MQHSYRVEISRFDPYVNCYQVTKKNVWVMHLSVSYIGARMGSENETVHLAATVPCFIQYKNLQTEVKSQSVI